jgi:hypothetical protein
MFKAYHRSLVIKMSDKIISFPNKYERRKRMDTNSGKLRCKVSER